LSEARAPRDLLAMAGALLGRADPGSAGLWPRASALLGRRALEGAVGRLWERRAFDPRSCPARVQILCLRTSLLDRDLAARAGLVWSHLRRASHHHAYELAPTAGELRGWLAVVDELIQKAG
jgi:hypothetical protein